MRNREIRKLQLTDKPMLSKAHFRGMVRKIAEESTSVEGTTLRWE
jgi:hypothetical protein